MLMPCTPQSCPGKYYGCLYMCQSCLYFLVLLISRTCQKYPTGAWCNLASSSYEPCSRFPQRMDQEHGSYRNQVPCYDVQAAWKNTYTQGISREERGEISTIWSSQDFTWKTHGDTARVIPVTAVLWTGAWREAGERVQRQLHVSPVQGELRRQPPAGPCGKLRKELGLEGVLPSYQRPAGVFPSHPVSS